VHQVLLNLISNAMKFTTAGEVTVTSSQHGASLRIAVSDTGIGVPERLQHRMFERFSQADASTTRRFGGTGLGLSISLQLVELMGGTMGFESREGVGSTFWMELPLSREGAPAAAPAGASALGAAVRWTRSEPLAAGSRVLLAEDNAVNQKVAAAILKKLGYEVDIASNGREAVDLARRRRYRFILMDCQMPDMDGFAATREIRSWEAAERSRSRAGSEGGAEASAVETAGDRSFIVALTASAMTDERDRCRAVGMDAFLAKPFDPAELNELLAGGDPEAARQPS
jgi:CheY-like chemotaxis protein